MSGDRGTIVLRVFLMLALFVAVFYCSWLYFKPKPQLGTFGAIAMSADATKFGASWGYSDPVGATQRSLAECVRYGGVNCVVKANLNNTCGVLTTSDEAKFSYVVTERDKVQAAALGLAQCVATGAGDCTVRQQFCGSGG